MSDSIRIGSDYRGRYQIGREIARGGTSSVYLAHDRWLSRDIALKKGHPGDQYTKDALTTIFANEDYILSRLQGNFAPSRFEFLPEDLELYMEYLPGHSLDKFLDQWVREGGFPADDVLLRIARNIFMAVQSCHRAGVIVADLKPRNIQIDRGTTADDLSIRLLDFGSAWASDRTSQQRDVDYSAGYGAPELLRREIPTYASDLYSLGAILFALLARQEPGLNLPPRNFGERGSLILPTLQHLVLRLTDDSPDRRPLVEESLATLRACEEELADLAKSLGLQCPQCQMSIPDMAARFCRHCGVSLTRETRVLTQELDTSGKVNPLTRMLEYEHAGEYMHSLYWAKQALKANRLPIEHHVRALGIALRVPAETDFALELASSISFDQLSEASLQRDYLVYLGHVLKARGESFEPKRELFKLGAKSWPKEELLWSWLYLASDQSQQEEVLRLGLLHHPESAKIRFYLGHVYYQRGARSEALTTWMEAFQKGEREPKFLRAVYQLALELEDNSRADVLREVILSGQPRNADEALDLVHFAAEEGRAAKALEAIELGLAKDPYNRDLRRCKAEVLLSQQKYELALDLDWVKSPGGDEHLRSLKARCLYELGRHAEAAQEMAAVIKIGKGTAEIWFDLIRCYQRLGETKHAREALNGALRVFPNDERLLRLNANRGN